MEPPRASIKAIFDDALELTDTAARAAFLDQACAQSPELRRKVEALLQAYTDAGSFLEKPAPHLEATGKHLPYGADSGSAARLNQRGARSPLRRSMVPKTSSAQGS